MCVSLVYLCVFVLGKGFWYQRETCKRMSNINTDNGYNFYPLNCLGCHNSTYLTGMKKKGVSVTFPLKHHYIKVIQRRRRQEINTNDFILLLPPPSNNSYVAGSLDNKKNSTDDLTRIIFCFLLFKVKLTK